VTSGRVIIQNAAVLLELWSLNSFWGAQMQIWQIAIIVVLVIVIVVLVLMRGKQQK